MKIWPWQWRKAQTTGVGAQVANAERGNIATTDKTDPEKNLEIYHVSLSVLSATGQIPRCGMLLPGPHRLTSQTENAAAELDDESTRARRV